LKASTEVDLPVPSLLPESGCDCPVYLPQLKNSVPLLALSTGFDEDYGDGEILSIVGFLPCKLMLILSLSLKPWNLPVCSPTFYYLFASLSQASKFSKA